MFQFHAEIAAAVGDARAALLLCFLISLPQLEPVSLDVITSTTGLTLGEVRNARIRLEALGLVKHSRTQHGTCYALNTQTLDEFSDSIRALLRICIRSRSKESNTGKSARMDLAQSELAKQTFDEVLNGAADIAAEKARAANKRFAPRPLLDVLLERWALTWDKKFAKLTTQRMRAWHDALANGATPSSFAKAILGMKRDEWVDRPAYCDWQHVARHHDRWVQLYEEGTQQRTPLRTVNTKAGVIRIPADYAWSDADEFMAAQGYRLNVATRQWEAGHGG